MALAVEPTPTLEGDEASEFLKMIETPEDSLPVPTPKLEEAVSALESFEFDEEQDS